MEISTVYLGEIEKKLNSYFNDKKVKKEVNTSIEEKVLSGARGTVSYSGNGSYNDPLRDEANNFCKILQSAIAGEDALSDNAKNAMRHMRIGHAKRAPEYTKSDNKLCCSIDVWFDQVSRPSLYPEGYPSGIDNLAALLNNGVDHEMKPVFGEWHGNRVRSETKLPGLDFVDVAINRSLGGNIIDIDPIIERK